MQIVYIGISRMVKIHGFLKVKVYTIPSLTAVSSAPALKITPYPYMGVYRNSLQSVCYRAFQPPPSPLFFFLNPIQRQKMSSFCPKPTTAKELTAKTETLLLTDSTGPDSALPYTYTTPGGQWCNCRQEGYTGVMKDRICQLICDWSP